MNKIFSVLLLVTFSFGIISCSNSEDPSGATSRLGQVLDQPNSTDDRNSIDFPVITSDSCYLIDNSTIDNSTVDKSSISDNSSIKGSTVINCSKVTRSIIINSTIANSKTCFSYVDNSTIDNSTLCSDNVSYSIINKTIQNQIMTEQTDPTVISVYMSGSVGAQNNIANAGDRVYARVNFSESVILDNTSGNPTLSIFVGSDNVSSDNRTSDFAFHATDTFDNDTMYFSYTIQSGDNDTDGISIDSDSLALNNSTIRDASGNYATITHQYDAAPGNIKVDTKAPTLVDNVSPTSHNCGSGDCQYGHSPAHVISLTATFSENVTVTGNPELYIFVKTDNRTATFASGNETTDLVFEYPIGQFDARDSNGISIGANSLCVEQCDSTIQDLAGNDATITHSVVDNNSDYKTKNY